jgi:hypothetical protein
MSAQAVRPCLVAFLRKQADPKATVNLDLFVPKEIPTQDANKELSMEPLPEPLHVALRCLVVDISVAGREPACSPNRMVWAVWDFIKGWLWRRMHEHNMSLSVVASRTWDFSPDVRVVMVGNAIRITAVVPINPALPLQPLVEAMAHAATAEEERCRNQKTGTNTPS